MCRADEPKKLQAQASRLGACLKIPRSAVLEEKAGWRGTTKENILGGSSTEEQRSQTAFSAKTLRAAGLLAVGSVGSVVTARCGNARTAPPCPQPKSLTAAPLAILRQALSRNSVHLSLPTTLSYLVVFALVLCPASLAQTDVARGKPVKTSAVTWPGLPAANLTDGNPNSVTHPLAETGTIGFTYEIDLLASFNLASIVVRNRVNCCPERLTNYRVSLHPHDLITGLPGPAVWSAVIRGNGSNSGFSGADVVTAGIDPGGVFSGRYIHIENLSGGAYNPQIAEVQAFIEDANTPNLALYRPVTSSAPTWSSFPPGNLTDGSYGSFTHPQAGSGTLGFTFEVDLLRNYALDRVLLYARGDGCCPERFTRCRLQLLTDVAGAPGVTNWSGDLRLDGSFPPSGAVEEIRATNGFGVFHGRYLRVISLSDEPYNPQLAEIEVYRAPGPTIRFFGASAGNITAVNSPALPLQTAISWRVEDATSVVLTPSIGAVTTTNSILLAPGETTSYTLTATNAGGSTSETIVIAVDAPSHPPLITEFAAENSSVLEDEDGDAPDWIELYNPNTFTLNMRGFHFTDDPDAKAKWTFSDAMIPPGGFLVVFASGKDRAAAGWPLHTNFQIAKGGEYLGLIAPDSVTVLSQFPQNHPAATSFPPQRDGVSHGVDDAGVERYFRPPTPGTRNGASSYSGFVADTVFSVHRGFYTNEQTLLLTCATPGAVIRFTTNGTKPTAVTGSVYTGPVLVKNTMTVRAAAFHDGLVPSVVVTHSYIFPDDVLNSSVLNTAIRNDPAFRSQLRPALADIPTVSLVLPGIALMNDTSETEVSFEFLDAFTGREAQANGGATYFGGAFTGFAKESFRVAFRGTYGDRKLKHPIFEGHDRGLRAATEFDAIELRGGSHDMVERGFYLSNPFTDSAMLEMGHISPHGRFVHVMINGTYWGVYHLRERWNAAMHATYLGGRKADYEAINGNYNVGGWAAPATPYDGDGSAWQRVLNLRADPVAVRPYLDVVNYIDYMITWMFGNAEDEWRCVGPVEAGSGFRFLINDADGWLSVNAKNQAVSWDGNQNNTAHSVTTPNRAPGDGPGSLFSMLHLHGGPDYRLLVADRIHKHLFGDGVLTPARNLERLEELAGEFGRPHLLESARWGYRSSSSWTGAVEVCRAQWLPPRTATYLTQLRAAGFYPAIDAPVCMATSADAGNLAISMTASGNAAIFYTVDDSDPRAPGGTASTTAKLYTVPDKLTKNSLIKVRARTADGAWSALNETFFQVGSKPVPANSVIVSEIFFNPDGNDDAEFLELVNVSTAAVNLRGARFTRGVGFEFSPWRDAVLAPGQRLILVASEHAFHRRFGWDRVAGGIYSDRLNNDGERLTFVTADGSETIFDFTFSKTWTRLADGGGHSLSIQREVQGLDPNDPGNWRPSFAFGGTPGTGEPGASFSQVFPGALRTGDENGDGIENFAHYALAGVNSLSAPTVLLNDGSATVTLTSWLHAREALVTAEISIDLRTWKPLAENAEITLTQQGVSETGLLSQQWKFDTRNAPSPRFVRLRIEER